MKAMRIVLLIFFVLSVAVHGFFDIRERIYGDTVPPVITAGSDELTVSVESSDKEFLAGMRATDNKDGDVTDSLVVVAKLDFIRKGVFKVNYAAFDSANNVATYTRRATYTDYRSPHFTADSPLRYDSSEYSSMLSNIRVDDVLDGDITANIRVTYGTVEGSKNPVILQITNSAGDTAVISLDVYVEDRLDATVPTPALDQYILYTEPGQRIDPGAHVVGVYQNKTVREFGENSAYSMDNISWDDSAVDYNTPGEYVVNYRLYNGDGELLGTTELYIVVEEVYHV